MYLILRTPRPYARDSHTRVSRASQRPYGTNIARGSSLPTKASMAKVTRK